MRWKLRDNMISLRLSYYLFKNKKTWYFDTWKMKYYKKCHYYKKKKMKKMKILILQKMMIWWF